MKVGSDREAALSPVAAKPDDVEIGVYYILFCAGGPSNIGPVMWEFTPINSLTTRWDLVAQWAPNAMISVISSKRNGKRPPSTIVF